MALTWPDPALLSAVRPRPDPTLLNGPGFFSWPDPTLLNGPGFFSWPDPALLNGPGFISWPDPARPDFSPFSHCF